ncbi:MAG: PIN domain-containing protein, partial [Planctomycetota bacterium]
ECVATLRAATDDLVTTDYVIDETLTLLSARARHDIALASGDAFWSGSMARLHRVSEADLAEAWRVFKTFTDKRWSFTDCTSYAVMQGLGITEALSLDDHFRQFGFVEVSP